MRGHAGAPRSAPNALREMSAIALRSGDLASSSQSPLGGTLNVMRPLRYSSNVTLDGCCDHRAILADEDLHRHAVENLDQADALLFGRVTYEMMEAAWRLPASTGPKPWFL